MQLALWYTAVFAALLVLFGLIFYAGLSAALASSFDATLASRTTQIAAGISEHQGTITLVDVTGQLPGLSSGPHDIDDSSAQSDPTPDADDGVRAALPTPSAATGTLVRILNVQGQPLYSSPAFTSLVVPSSSISEAQRGASWWGTFTSHRGERIRLYSVPLLHDGAVFGVLQVGESLDSLDHTLQAIGLAWFLLAPFALLLSAFGGYGLASRAFRPIDRLSATARQIEASDLHQRVAVPATGDEVQRLALTFNEMIARLESAFARERRFVADASHELRAPVAAIASMTEVALERPSTAEEYQAVLRDVNSEAQRLGRLVGDLLALARADEGRAQLQFAPVRLDELVAEVAAVMATLAEERGITLEVRAAEPVAIRGDEPRLIQAVVNLLDNALTYTPRGGLVTLEVGARGDEALVSVRDTGVGIAPEHVPHIFERFYRADPARTPASGGAGLGLAIVDWVVRAHGGQIEVSSEPGSGTTFTMSFPAGNAKHMAGQGGRRDTARASRPRHETAGRRAE
jgi:heavy metal sensor kinase